MSGPGWPVRDSQITDSGTPLATARSRTARASASLHLLLCSLEDAHAELVDQIAELAEHASAVRDSPTITLRAYASDADYWADDARAREAGLPSALHRTATAHAAYLVREELSIHVAIVPARL